MAFQDAGPGKRPGDLLRQASMAWELPFILVGSVLIGGGAGYFLDHWLHTAPALMLVLGLLGFAGGIWDMLRRLSGTKSAGEGHGG
jgi:F0F1-type ATP synthase assembly protein I